MMTYLEHVIVGILLTALTILAAVILNRRQRRSVAKERDEAESSPRKPYSWAEYRRDLADPAISFEELWERCDGRIPERPEDLKGSNDGGSW